MRRRRAAASQRLLAVAPEVTRSVATAPAGEANEGPLCVPPVFEVKHQRMALDFCQHRAARRLQVPFHFRCTR